MYTIKTKTGDIAFKNDNVCAVSIEKIGRVFPKYTLFVSIENHTIRIDDMEKDSATEHYNILHDMIIDQEG